jgi:hypothetical protein
MPEQFDEDVIRQMINAENTVLNHRLTWFATLEGLLFSALGFAWGKPDAHALVRVLAVLGIVAALCSLGLIMSATRAMFRLHFLWEKQQPANYDGPGVTGLPPAKSWIARWLGAWWIYFPVFFIWGWARIWFLASTIASH